MSRQVLTSKWLTVAEIRSISRSGLAEVLCQIRQALAAGKAQKRQRWIGDCMVSEFRLKPSSLIYYVVFCNGNFATTLWAKNSREANRNFRKANRLKKETLTKVVSFSRNRDPIPESFYKNLTSGSGEK